jgi:cation diffusion facilitator CzcD-associated flavoprotein CzcO
MAEHVEVAVIGGGQAGLALSEYLTHIRASLRAARAPEGGLS